MTRRHSAAAERNQAPLLAELLRRLPDSGRALEIASGTGQHAAHFAAGLPGWTWQPSDGDPATLPSIDSWCAGLLNVLPARLLDVTDLPWTGLPEPCDLVFSANMLHISPWSSCAALMAGAANALAQGGLLLVYGPFEVEGQTTAPSNADFDRDLRQRDPRWGLRRLGEVRCEAEAHGLCLRESVAMPANNLLLVFGRANVSPRPASKGVWLERRNPIDA